MPDINSYSPLANIIDEPLDISAYVQVASDEDIGLNMSENERYSYFLRKDFNKLQTKHENLECENRSLRLDMQNYKALESQLHEAFCTFGYGVICATIGTMLFSSDGLWGAFPIICTKVAGASIAIMSGIFCWLKPVLTMRSWNAKQKGDNNNK
jgi:hypothetical protein